MLEYWGKYVPLALIIAIVAGVIVIEHSIINGRHPGMDAEWMSYGLEVFVFVLFAVAIFVIGAMHRELGQWGDSGRY
jgi:hypothetical protein